jgi:hypothetical protein
VNVKGTRPGAGGRREDEGYRRLAAAVVMQAALDVRRGPGPGGSEQLQNYRSAHRFLASEWGRFLAGCIGLDAERLLRTAEGGGRGALAADAR